MVVREPLRRRLALDDRTPRLVEADHLECARLAAPHCTRSTLEICVEASSASIGSVTPKAAFARRGVNSPLR